MQETRKCCRCDGKGWLKPQGRPSLRNRHLRRDCPDCEGKGRRIVSIGRPALLDNVAPPSKAPRGWGYHLNAVIGAVTLRSHNHERFAPEALETA